jgi:1,4-alpha-glucan branching enzyme
MWLPECAYSEGVETYLQEANIRWFLIEAHGLLHSTPKPRYAVFAPILAHNGIAAFGRDLESAKQVWSRQEGYPGDPRYRDFYRDAGFDLELDYLKPHLPAPEHRGFTGLKYYCVTGSGAGKKPYDRKAALQAAAEHAEHFLQARIAQFARLESALDRPPLIVSPYDAELFGHWWYEGPEFLDLFVRKAGQHFSLITPSQYLERHPTNQVAKPSPSSWGEEGYWRVWLNETNEWILPHLQAAQERMTELARGFSKTASTSSSSILPGPLQERALKQAARELLLAQASDWPFILRTGTSPDYARIRVTSHLLRFTKLHEQLLSGCVDEKWLGSVESADNLFPDIDYRYWM